MDEEKMEKTGERAGKKRTGDSPLGPRTITHLFLTPARELEKAPWCPGRSAGFCVSIDLVAC